MVETMQTTPLENGLHRYGDDLYRLALLLTLDPARAAKALLAMVRRLAQAPDAPGDEPALIDALVAELPRERRRLMRRAPPWVHRTGTPPSRRALLAAFGDLPRPQRLALALSLLRNIEPEQSAAILGVDQPQVGALVGEALLALAPHAEAVAARPDQRPAEETVHTAFQQLFGPDVPEACRHTRTAILQGAAHADPTARGHLALCPECRAAEQERLFLATTVEETLRSAFDAIHVPDDLAAQLQKALAGGSDRGHRLTEAPWVRVAAVPAVVLALILLLVLPRSLSRTVETPTSSESTPPRVLVDRALDTLYAPPPGPPWHGRWQIFWPFADGSSTYLNADAWLDPAGGRHRVQLVHQAGGGPYEFQLADGTDSLWYAVNGAYAPSLYPLMDDWLGGGVTIELPRKERERMLQARLDSGAWGIAQNYLRQAQGAADLRGLGRRRAGDGTLLDLISFRGVSPLALPPDAPGGEAARVTVLLAIDGASGALREISELVGPAEGEQVGRTVWRFVSGGPIAPPDLARVFVLRHAWSGADSFIKRDRPVDPALPLLELSRVTPLTQAVNEPLVILPEHPPPGVTAAALVLRPPGMAQTLVVYTGDGRSLSIGSRFSERGSGQDLPRGCVHEKLMLNEQEFVLCPRAAQSYEVTINNTRLMWGSYAVVRVGARGYTRAELVEVLAMLGPLRARTLQSQWRLFIDPDPRDSATLDALVGALDTEPLSPGRARRTVARMFTRHHPQPETLPDPYHVPPYDGLPETIEAESWTRVISAAAGIEYSALTRTVDGQIANRSFGNADVGWWHDLRRDAVSIYDGSSWDGLTQSDWMVLTLLRCGGTLQTLPGGERAVVYAETNWVQHSCARESYSNLLAVQQVQSPVPGESDHGPYLADLASFTNDNLPLTFALVLGPNDHVQRMEVRLGPVGEGTLLESWELITDEIVPVERVPPGVFDPQAPPALIVNDYRSQPAGRAQTAIRTATLTETAALVTTPLFELARRDDVSLAMIEVNTAPLQRRFYDNVSNGAINQALNRGAAVRFSYMVSAPDRPRLTYLIQGPADRFGAYLRSGVRWRSSQPVTLRADGREVQGWRVEDENQNTWHLLELDGTLLALAADTPEQQALVERLQRVTPR